MASCLVDFSGNDLNFSHLSKMLAKELLNVIIMCVIMPTHVPLFLDSLDFYDEGMLHFIKKHFLHSLKCVVSVLESIYMIDYIYLLILC